MNTDNNNYLRMLVLVPHRDYRHSFNEYKQKLFGLGLKGAYSFPVAAPLAIVSKSLNHDELRKIAHEARKITLQDKIRSGKNALAHIPDNCVKTQQPVQTKTAFFGPVLNINADEIFSRLNNKPLYIFPKTILCASLVSANDIHEISEPSGKSYLDMLPEMQTFSFRAAAISNLIIRPLPGGDSPFSVEWRLRGECWLPSKISHCLAGS